MPLLAIAFSCSSYAAEPIESDLGIDEVVSTQNLPPATVDHEHFEIKVWNTKYKISKLPFTEEQEAIFNSLTYDQKLRFLERREGFLKTVARITNLTKPVTGTCAIAYNRVKCLVKKDAPRVKVSIKEKGNQITQDIIEKIDKELWNNASAMGRSEEVGISLMAYAQAGAAVPKKFKLFSGQGLGLAVSTAPDGKVIFEVFHEKESLTRAITWVARGEAGLRAQFFQKVSTGSLIQKGEMVTIPPVFSFLGTPDLFAGGVGHGLGLPGAALMAYESEITRTPIIRVQTWAEAPINMSVQSPLFSNLKAVKWLRESKPFRCVENVIHKIF